MTEIILTHVQGPKMGFLRRVHGVTKGRTEVRLGPGQDTNLPPPYLNLRSFGSKCTALKKKLGTLLGLFGASQWFGAWALCPFVMPWCDTSRQIAQLWNSKNPECRTISPNRENTTTLVRPCIQNAPRKTGEASPAGYTHGKATQMPSKDQVEWLHLRPTLLGPVLVWSQ